MGASASALKEAPSTLQTSKPPRSPRTFFSLRSAQRLAKGPARLSVLVQLAGPGDDVTDSSVAWPMSRTEIPFGTITLTGRVDDAEPERRKIIFDPIPRVDGIDSSGDPLTEVRVGALSAQRGRRRAATVK